MCTHKVIHKNPTNWAQPTMIDYHRLNVVAHKNLYFSTRHEWHHHFAIRDHYRIWHDQNGTHWVLIPCRTHVQDQGTTHVQVLLISKAHQLWTSTAWTCGPVCITHTRTTLLAVALPTDCAARWRDISGDMCVSAVQAADAAASPSSTAALLHHQAALLLRRIMHHQSKWHKHLQMLFPRLRTIKRMIAGHRRPLLIDG